MRRRGTVAALAMVLTAVAGCTSPTSGTPTSVRELADTRTATPTGTSTADEVPEISDPIDAEQFVADPCATLSRSQVDAFGLRWPGDPMTEGAIATNVGPGCIWHAPVETYSSAITLLVGNKNGLADTYRSRQYDVYFIETTIAGYPAVFHDIIDLRDRGNCPLVVGIADDLAFLSLEQGDLVGEAACDRAAQVAAAAIATMKGAG